MIFGKRKIIQKVSIKTGFNASLLNKIQSNVQKIFSKLDNFEYRLKYLENKGLTSQNLELIEYLSQHQFFRILKASYNSRDKTLEILFQYQPLQKE